MPVSRGSHSQALAWLSMHRPSQLSSSMSSLAYIVSFGICLQNWLSHCARCVHVRANSMTSLLVSQTPRCRCPSNVSHGAAVRASEPSRRNSLPAHHGMFRLEHTATMFHGLLHERLKWGYNSITCLHLCEQHLFLALAPIRDH
jgi:hypothetical protein